MAKGYPVTNSIVTPECRASFVNLLKPEIKKGDKGDYEKWGMACLFPHDTDMSAVKRMAQEAINLAWPNEADRPRKFRVFLKDGDNGDHTNDGVPAGEKWSGYAGCYYFSAISYRQPGIVHQKDISSPIIDEKEVYGGMWCRCQIAAQAYKSEAGYGVRVYLQNVMKTRDDEKLGAGGEAASSAFASYVTDETPAQDNSSAPDSAEGSGIFG